MDDLEAAWRHEQQVAEAREAREQALSDCDMLLALRPERPKAWETAPEPPKPVRRAVEPRPRPAAPPPGVDWNATKAWVEAIVGRKIDREIVPLAGEVAADINALQGRIATLEARLLEMEVRAGQESRIVEIERRLLEAEQRAASTGPRLVVGGTDAA